MVSFHDKPIMDFTTPAQWQDYLAGDPDPGGVRLRLRKKAAVDPGIERGEALDVALCFGWIDGQVGRYDDQFVLQSYSPRRRNSPWSKINVARVGELIEMGRMQPGGFAEIERAQADGRWDSAYRMADREVPPEVLAAIATVPGALAVWEAAPTTARFGWVLRYQQLRRQTSRQARVEALLAALATGHLPD